MLRLSTVATQAYTEGFLSVEVFLHEWPPHLVWWIDKSVVAPEKYL